MNRPWIFAASFIANALLFAMVIAGQHSTLQRMIYPMLSPRIFVQNKNDTIINFTDLRSQIQAFVGNQKDIHAGVYFEYLPSGVSVGVNSNDQFVSASLIKVPLIMGVEKMLQTGALRDDTQITLREQDLDPNFGTLWRRGAGATLTVKEALELAVKESDNTAALALDALMPRDPIREVYDALDIPVDWNGDQPVVSAKNYSSVFRCLYLSCFLDYSRSQYILGLLTQTIFDDGFPAGVPAGIPVAHKIGMYDSPTTNKRVRLDCGIVYVPKRPYILCILSETEKGKEELIPEFARQVSAQVYRFVSAANAL
jgi:beta-lactamase class A